MVRNRSKSRERTPPHLPSLDVETNGNGSHSASLRGSHHSRVPEIPNQPLNTLLPQLDNDTEHPLAYYVTQNVVLKLADDRPPWLSVSKSSEKGVYDFFKNNTRFQTKLIDEFVKDALFLEISGMCASIMTETESSNQEEAKINGWLESQVITDEVYHLTEKIVWETLWDTARKMEKEDVDHLHETYRNEPPDENMLQILKKRYSTPLKPEEGKPLLTNNCGEIIYHLNKMMLKGTLMENYAIRKLQDLVITQVAGKVVLDEALKFMEDHMAEIDEEERIENPPRNAS
ncbi:uncharacterized protein LOC131888121 [Tigriopus californicus]|nr:uncharacterized protein LOC131888121 [Tigriopus californicus]